MGNGGLLKTDIQQGPAGDIPDTIEGVYRILRPATPSPLVFDSPHSGRTYPADFNAAVPVEALRAAEDSQVDALFACAPALGGALLCADFPRTYIDVNREAGDIDPELVTGILPFNAAPTTRSAAGIGLVRRLVRPGLPLYARKLDIAEVEHRLDRYYLPYHRALGSLIEAAHYRFGVVWHVNCHSMPAVPGRGQADFVLGDRDGTSCAPDFLHGVRNSLLAMGYKVAVNHPYKGVEIVRRHGRPQFGYNSLQLEISRALYWNEGRHDFNRRAMGTQAAIQRLVAFCADFAGESGVQLAAD